MFVKNIVVSVFFIVFALSFNASAKLPTILYEKDIKTYKTLFKGKINDIKKTDKLIKNINNNILLGYVLHKKYLSPYYKTKFNEIKDWLINYNDHPNAGEIYKLGLKKGAKKDLTRPTKTVLKTTFFENDSLNNHNMIQYSYRYLPKKQKSDIDYSIKIFNRRLRKGYTKNARQILENYNVKKYINKDDYLRMQSYLAYAYFLNNEIDMAILWGKEPANKLNYYLANWTLGLSYWLKKDYINSRNYFKKIAFIKQIDPNMVSAAAFWAYRANESIDKDELKDSSDYYLEIASNYPKTFYGILASKKLNKDLVIDWEEPNLSLENIREILSYKGGIRAIALLQLGMKKEAIAELKFLIENENTDNYSPGLINAVLAIADLGNLPSLSIDISNYIKEYSDANTFASSKYPIIELPSENWNIDRALVNALIRQESMFNPYATSRVGARGLMQIMPSTASFIMNNRSLKTSNKSKLFDEHLNLEIGQTYIDYLLNLKNINNNLLKFLVAYNAGPGNLKKQEDKIINPDNDPLLFIESISLKETRIYVKRVMANFWIYRNKMGKDSESLETLLSNNWPVYISKENHYVKNKNKYYEKYFENYMQELNNEKEIEEDVTEETEQEILNNT